MLFRNARARNTHVEATLNLSFPAQAPFVSNNVARMDGVHSVTVFVRVDVAGEPDAEVREPHKCHEWAWHAIGDALPEPVFPPLASLAASPYWASLKPAP